MRRVSRRQVLIYIYGAYARLDSFFYRTIYIFCNNCVNNMFELYMLRWWCWRDTAQNCMWRGKYENKMSYKNVAVVHTRTILMSNKLFWYSHYSKRVYSRVLRFYMLSISLCWRDGLELWVSYDFWYENETQYVVRCAMRLNKIQYSSANELETLYDYSAPQKNTKHSKPIWCAHIRSQFINT